ncbi:MAG: hypothetical protein AB7O38_27095, partial [Pirellulaceae bacterium]
MSSVTPRVLWLSHSSRNHFRRQRRLGRRRLLLEALEGRRLLAVLDVTRFDDPLPDGCVPGDCSLREAILASNGNLQDDTIQL